MKEGKNWNWLQIETFDLRTPQRGLYICKCRRFECDIYLASAYKLYLYLGHPAERLGMLRTKELWLTKCRAKCSYLMCEVYRLGTLFAVGNTFEKQPDKPTFCGYKSFCLLNLIVRDDTCAVFRLRLCKRKSIRGALNYFHK